MRSCAHGEFFAERVGSAQVERAPKAYIKVWAASTGENSEFLVKKMDQEVNTTLGSSMDPAAGKHKG